MTLCAFVSVASASAAVGVYLSPATEEVEAEKYHVNLSGGEENSFFFELFGAGQGTCTNVGILMEGMDGPREGLVSRPSYNTSSTKCSQEGRTVVFPGEPECGFVSDITWAWGAWGGGHEQLLCGEKTAGLEFSQIVNGTSVCTATVLPQKFVDPWGRPMEVSYSNSGTGSGRSLSSSAMLSYVKYTRTGSGCVNGTGTYANGALYYGFQAKGF